jgi:peptidyl-prolyl cis-trans isomerase SurA
MTEMMKTQAFKPLLCAFALATGLLAQAQTAKPPAVAQQPADYIIAVVNSEPITDSEVRTEVGRVRQEFERSSQAIPPADELRKAVLERLINERAQLQVARETGIRIDDSQVDQAEQSIARQNQIDIPELRRRLSKDGLTLSRFRDQLYEQLMLSRLREREVEGKLRISDQDVDRALAEELAKASEPGAVEVNLAQILISVPEKANAEVRAARLALAEKTLERLRTGAAFDTVATEVSAADASNGGQLGLRRGDRYPPLFLEATQRLQVGGLSDLVRSDAGFHILRVVERKPPARPTRSTVQTRARHILLRPTAQANAKDVASRLASLKQKAESGAAKFETLAKENSLDGSAPQGGDLGWSTPGMYVPEFEEIMNSLPEGKISEPFASRFGLHILQVVERKRVELTTAEVREQVRAQLRESRYDEAYVNWAKDVRGRAFIEMREPPL